MACDLCGWKNGKLQETDLDVVMMVADRDCGGGALTRHVIMTVFQSFPIVFSIASWLQAGAWLGQDRR